MKENDSTRDQMETLEGEVSILRPRLIEMQNEVLRLKKVIEKLSTFVGKDVCVRLLIDPDADQENTFGTNL